jgi:APA family basic amino acid/polyamine antiporter
LLGSLVLIGLYVFAVLGYLVALGPARAAESEAIAASAVNAVLGPWAGKLVALTILLSVFSATNSVVLTAPRVFYAMAKDNLFFRTLAEVQPRFHTPAAAIIVLCLWSAALTFAGKFSELIEGVVFVGWIFYGLSGAAIFTLRAKLRRSGGSEQALPYRVPGYPWTPIVFLIAAAAVVGNAIFLATNDPTQFRHVLAALILMALGVPAYFFWRWRNGSRSRELG